MPNAYAHIITGDTVALADPEVLIMADDRPDGRMGCCRARLLTSFRIGPDADLDAVLTRLRLIEGWAPDGLPMQVERGYWIVRVVERGD